MLWCWEVLAVGAQGDSQGHQAGAENWTGVLGSAGRCWEWGHRGTPGGARWGLRTGLGGAGERWECWEVLAGAGERWEVLGHAVPCATPSLGHSSPNIDAAQQ